RGPGDRSVSACADLPREQLHRCALALGEGAERRANSHRGIRAPVPVLWKNASQLRPIRWTCRIEWGIRRGSKLSGVAPRASRRTLHLRRLETVTTLHRCVAPRDPMDHLRPGGLAILNPRQRAGLPVRPLDPGSRLPHVLKADPADPDVGYQDLIA